jgi:hypothetical protein
MSVDAAVLKKSDQIFHDVVLFRLERPVNQKSGKRKVFTQCPPSAPMAQI